MIENVRLSEKAKIQLITVKKRTGIQNWNVLCRWAICLSLQEKTPPPLENIVADSSVEMSWRTFAGVDENLYLALIIKRAREDGIDLNKASINNYFKLHLHRGISYLNGARSDSIEGLHRIAITI
jgi:DNA sulfur modification protein DndE